MWSHLDATQLRARLSGQFRIVGLAYLGGGGLAAFCLVALLLFVPAVEVVRDVLGVPLQQLFEELLPPSTPPVAAADVESPQLTAAVLASVAEPLESPLPTSVPTSLPTREVALTGPVPATTESRGDAPTASVEPPPLLAAPDASFAPLPAPAEGLAV